MAKRWKTVHGFTHSRGAVEAEERGEWPITTAVEVVYISIEGKQRGISRRKVRSFLEANCSAGWHHVAGYNNVREICYYATALSEEQRALLLATSRKKPASQQH